jgi:hypothetical protein
MTAIEASSAALEMLLPSTAGGRSKNRVCLGVKDMDAPKSSESS